MKNWLNGWQKEADAPIAMLNDTAVRIRAGILMAIPLFMAYTLLHTTNGSPWVVTGNLITDTYETDFSGRILYQVEAVRRTYEYSLQTNLLLYALFEMLAGMFRWSSIISPTIWIAKTLARRRAAEWKPLTPKRFAWTFGAVMIMTCLIFFNPDTFATWINTIARTELLPTTRNYMPGWIPNALVIICVSFMWMEAILGICAGCVLYSVAVKLGWVKEPCVACNDLSFNVDDHGSS
ncbi:MAG: DUF4395 family protein [Burkholderiales bacterium]|nr:DUF4395 family protein [Burkholderiales bacterium]